MIAKNATAQLIKPYSNPAFMYGSDFMSFMQACKKTGNYNLMLRFTSSSTIKKFGKEKIMAYYKEKFNNMSKLMLTGIVSYSNNKKTMNYVNKVVATENAISIDIIIENDSCKLIINDLSKQLLN